jgi:hypothetical protein
MKIKPKGSSNIQEITPVEWGKIVKLGTSDQYEIIERNTVWGAPMNEKGEYFESHKREFEYNEWLLLLEKGANHRYKFLERINTNQSFLKKIYTRIEVVINPNSKPIKQPFNRFEKLMIKFSVAAIVVAIIIPFIILSISNGWI